MEATYACKVGIDYEPDSKENIKESLFKQYEYVIVESLITSFGLDFLVKDQHGGDVDTIHNVRQIGKDSEMTYKNSANKSDYENRGAYNSNDYHNHSEYKKKNKEIKQQQENGTLIDEYTGKKMAANEKKDLDHVISAKEIHEDPGRVLAELNGSDLANCDENLKATSSSINRSKKDMSTEEYIKKLEKDQEIRKQRINDLKAKDSLTDKEKNELNKLQKQESVDKEKMMALDKEARKKYEKKLAKKYYTSPKFAKDTAIAAGKVGAKMGARQALGLVFAEIWFSVKEEFSKLKNGFHLKEFFISIKEGIKKGVLNAKEKFGDIIKKFFEGALAGALSSITTTLCNIFFTTAKNVVKIIRQTWASIVQAFKVLFFNPDNLPFRERMKSVATILATGASVVVGTFVTEAISNSVIGKLPVIGSVASAFCGALVSGILSCTMVYLIDKSDKVWKLFNRFNPVARVERDIEFYKQQSIALDEYAAKLMEIDIDSFRKETFIFGTFADKLQFAKSEKQLNEMMIDLFDKLNIDKPYQGTFDDFMNDDNAVLVFK